MHGYTEAHPSHNPCIMPTHALADPNSGLSREEQGEHALHTQKKKNPHTISMWLKGEILAIFDGAKLTQNIYSFKVQL